MTMKVVLLLAIFLAVAYARSVPRDDDHEVSIRRLIRAGSLEELYNKNANYVGGSRNDRTTADRDKAHNRNPRLGGGDTYYYPSDNVKDDETRLIQHYNSPNNKQKVSNLPTGIPGNVYVRVPW